MSNRIRTMLLIGVASCGFSATGIAQIPCTWS
jgi:hypothetical protein